MTTLRPALDHHCVAVQTHSMYSFQDGARWSLTKDNSGSHIEVGCAVWRKLLFIQVGAICAAKIRDRNPPSLCTSAAGGLHLTHSAGQQVWASLLCAMCKTIQLGVPANHNSYYAVQVVIRCHCPEAEPSRGRYEFWRRLPVLSVGTADTSVGW